MDELDPMERADAVEQRATGRLRRLGDAGDALAGPRYDPERGPVQWHNGPDRQWWQDGFRRGWDDGR